MDNNTTMARDRRLASRAPGSKPGAGLLQWNGAGWLGSQFGGTLWIAFCGGSLAGFDIGSSALVFGLFLGANVIGFGLWRARSRLAPHPGVQLLCLTLFAAGAGTFWVLYEAGQAEKIAEGWGGGLSLPLWAYLGIYPLLMLLFFWVDRRGLGQATKVPEADQKQAQ